MPTKTVLQANRSTGLSPAIQVVLVAMNRMRPNFFLLLLVMSVAGCSSTASETVPTASPTARGELVSTEATTVPSPAPTDTAPPGVSPTSSPVAGSSELDGTLYFIGYEDNAPAVFALDLVSGTEQLVFKPPETAWLSELAISPSGDQLLLAYSPPPGEGQVQYGFTDLYLMASDGSELPRLLLQEDDPSDSYFNVSWPLEDTIFYAHFRPAIDADGNITYGSQVERFQLPEMKSELIAPSAAWPRVSDDGALLSYVTDANDLILANGDGSEPRTLLDSGTFTAVDAPVFSPDKSRLCFSAVDKEEVSAPSLIGRLLGLQIVSAHSVPSDWWCIDLGSGGELHRLTEMDAIGFYGDFSPDGRHLAFITIAGLYTMRADGSELSQLQQRPLIGTVNWAP